MFPLWLLVFTSCFPPCAACVARRPTPRRLLITPLISFVPVSCGIALLNHHDSWAPMVYSANMCLVQIAMVLHTWSLSTSSYRDPAVMRKWVALEVVVAIAAVGLSALSLRTLAAANSVLLVYVWNGLGSRLVQRFLRVKGAAFLQGADDSDSESDADTVTTADGNGVTPHAATLPAHAAGESIDDEEAGHGGGGGGGGLARRNTSTMAVQSHSVDRGDSVTLPVRSTARQGTTGAVDVELAQPLLGGHHDDTAGAAAAAPPRTLAAKPAKPGKLLSAKGTKAGAGTVASYHHTMSPFTFTRLEAFADGVFSIVGACKSRDVHCCT